MPLPVCCGSNYIADPHSIYYTGINKLPPASLLAWKVGAAHSKPAALLGHEGRGRVFVDNPFTGSDAEAVEELERLVDGRGEDPHDLRCAAGAS